MEPEAVEPEAAEAEVVQRVEQKAASPQTVFQSEGFNVVPPVVVER